MRTPTSTAIRTFLITLACALLMLPGPALAAGEKVTISVIGPDGSDAPVYYAPATEIELAEGDDAWTATAAVLDGAGLAHDAENSAYGVFLNSITSPIDGSALAFDEATGRYWQLYVDGVASEVGISEVEPADGMQIVWCYSAFGDELPASVGELSGTVAPASGSRFGSAGAAVAAVVVVAVVAGGIFVMRLRKAA